MNIVERTYSIIETKTLMRPVLEDLGDLTLNEIMCKYCLNIQIETGNSNYKKIITPNHIITIITTISSTDNLVEILNTKLIDFTYITHNIDVYGNHISITQYLEDENIIHIDIDKIGE